MPGAGDRCLALTTPAGRGRPKTLAGWICCCSVAGTAKNRKTVGAYNQAMRLSVAPSPATAIIMPSDFATKQMRGIAGSIRASFGS